MAKPASVEPNGGEVSETTITKRILPAVPGGKKETPEFWDYFEAIKADDWSPYRHKLFVYRYQGDAPSGVSEQMEKNEAGAMAMPDGEQVPLTNREDTEYAITKKFGGGLFRLILKRGSERVTQTHVHTDGPRKAVRAAAYQETDGPVVSAMGNESDSTAAVAHHAITTLAGQDRAVMDVAVNAVKGAAEIVQRMSATQTPPAAATSETDQLMKMLMVKMMERMMNPPDPIELLTKLMALQGSVSGNGSVGNPFWAKIQEAAVDKLLNPGPSGPVSSAGAELVRQLPQVASYVTSAIAEWRAGTEAQLQTAAIMRGVQPPAGRPAPAPGTVLPAAPAQNPTPGGVVAPSLEFIESRIVQIFREPVAAEEAADKTLEFLETLDPQLVEQLKAQGEPGLIALFHSRPTLRPATQNVPRLTEFIRAFLKFASEPGEGDGTAIDAGTKPN